jgi:hypothetical protein
MLYIMIILIIEEVSSQNSGNILDYIHITTNYQIFGDLISSITFIISLYIFNIFNQITIADDNIYYTWITDVNT